MSARDEKLAAYHASLERANRFARESFLGYCRHVELFGEEAPALHHEYLISKLMEVEKGEIKRLMVFMPPGSAKSTYTSVRFSSWYLGRHPKHNIIQASHTGSLAARFGRKVRNIIGGEVFQSIFPGVTLSKDSQARGDWSTNQGGEYYAVGMDGAIPGRRADGVLIDDPVKGRKEADSETVREGAWETYKTDIRSRLRKGGWIILIMTRWHEDDPAGRILREDWNGKTGWTTARDGERWFVINVPMEAEEDDVVGRKPGETLWPEWFTPSWVAQEKVTQGSRNWNALFQGRPTTEEGAILKAGFWRKWGADKPPVCEYVLQSIDGAYEEGEDNDYSARTTWGIFDLFQQDNAQVLEGLLKGKKRKEIQRYHAILLEAWRGKVQFSVFKRTVAEGFEEYRPDRLLIEKKASGISLIQELRKAALPVKAVMPDRSKKSRAHAAEIPFEQGCVWYVDRAWAQAVIRECTQFPNGEYDDWVDTVTQAMIWMRRTYHLEFREEEDDAPGPSQAPSPIYG